MHTAARGPYSIPKVKNFLGTQICCVHLHIHSLQDVPVFGYMPQTKTACIWVIHPCTFFMQPPAHARLKLHLQSVGDCTQQLRVLVTFLWSLWVLFAPLVAVCISQTAKVRSDTLWPILHPPRQAIDYFLFFFPFH